MSNELDKLGIPIPKNVAPGDTMYESQGEVKGQKLAYEPPAELVEIPSHGYLYKDICNDPEILEKGAIRIRPMTVHEEKIISTPRLVKSGQALDMIFKNVIKSNIDTKKLLSSDRVFLLLWLRSVSYGNQYKFKLQCPNTNCQKRFEYSVDLSQHPVKEFENEDIKEPFTITLPVSKATLEYRLPRGGDEEEIINMQNKPKAINDADDAIVTRLSSAVLKIILSDGTELSVKEKTAFIEGLIARDASLFRQALEKNDCGIEDITGITCPYCEYEFDTTIPLTESFFRTTE
jgi:hypothetical protein